MRQASVIGTGVATLDIYPKQGRMYPGGNEYNVVCNVAKLGGKAAFLGVFGNDQAGRILEDTLNDLSIDTSYSHHEIGSSGFSIVELKDGWDRKFLYWNQQGVTDLHPIQFTEEEINYIKQFDVLTMGLLADVSDEMVKYVASQGISICYDFNDRSSKEKIIDLAPYVDYGFFSCSHMSVEEIHEVLELAVRNGMKVAVCTRGVDSVFAHNKDNYYEQPTYPVKPLDTLGAGDSYIGCFLNTYLSYEDGEIDEASRISKALDTACRHSASVVLAEGSIGIGYDVKEEEVENIVEVPEGLL